MAFIILYIIVIITCLASGNGKRKKPRILACMIIFVTMQVLIGLRHIQYGGVDTQIYARDFTRIIIDHYSFADIFTGFFKDFGFYLFAKLFSLFSSNMNAWIFVCALPYTFGVTWLIYRYSDDMFLSFMIFLSYGFYLYNFQLMRHVFALAIIILANKYLQEGRIKKFFATVLVAAFFHTIAIVFLGAYFVRKGGISFKQFVWITAGGVVVLLLSRQAILSTVFRAVPFLSSGRFAQYETRGGSFSSEFIIQVFFILVSWYFLYGKKRETPAEIQLVSLLNMAVIASFFYLLTIVIGESYRIAQYFSLFTIILVPNALRRAHNKKLAFLIASFIVVFGIKRFFGGLFVENSVYDPYVFFWQAAQYLY